MCGSLVVANLKMKYFLKFSVLAFIYFVFISCESDNVNSGIVLQKVDREIDLVSQLVKIRSKITVANRGKGAVKAILFSVESSNEKNIGWITANAGKDKSNLNIVKTTVQKNSDASFWRINLASPLQPEKTVVLNVDVILTHSLDPYPSRISQSEKQFVVYSGNHFLYTPYEVTTQTTTVKLPSGKVESYTKSKKPVSLSNSIITYGPYEKTPAFSYEKLRVHNENNSPFLSVTKLERTIEISHWGNIAVEESINVRHNGAILKGSFSRYEYQTEHSGVSAVKGYKTILPASASDVYYRDEIGNISTSHLKNQDDAVELELRPRFPLFGGWKTQYKIGYNLPSYEYLFSSGNQFGLKMRFVDHIFDESVIDEVTIKIILPEGCGNIKLDIPYSVNRDKDGLHFTYLDTRGRPVVIAHKSNLVENHIQDFKMYYTFDQILMLQEPLLVVVALYLLFIAIIIYVRLDFSISQDEAAESKLKVSGYCSHITNHQERREDIYHRFTDALNKFKTSKDNNALQNALKKLNTEHKAETQAIADLQSKLKNESGDIADKVADLQKLDKSMKELITQQTTLIDRLVTGKVNKSSFIDSENTILKKKEDVLDKMEAIISHL